MWHKILLLLFFFKSVYLIQDYYDQQEEFSASESDDFTQLSDTIFPLHYHGGFRASGDHLIYHRQKHHKYWWKKNVKAVIHYPSKGSHGSRITAFEAYVNQTSNKGWYNVTSGGVGHNWITLVIYAQSTKRFDYNVLIYGFNH